MKRIVHVIITIFAAGLCLAALSSCVTKVEPFDNVVNANEDDYFIRISEVMSLDESHDFERVQAEDASAEILNQIDKVVLGTEGTWGIGNLYQTQLTDANGTYVLFLMDTVDPSYRPTMTPGGETWDINWGKRICKWALYKIVPLAM